MSDRAIYSRPVARFTLEVEPNASGMNDSRVVLRGTFDQSVRARFTVEELRDLHYVTGRAIAAVELEQSTSCSKN